MRSQQTTNPVAIKLIRDLIDRLPEKASGVYNNADPTAFSSGGDIFPVLGHSFKIKFFNCTWGVEIEIYIIKKISDKSYYAMMEREEKKPIYRRNCNKIEFFTEDCIVCSHLISNFYLSGFGSKYDPYVLIIRKKQRGIYKVIREINKKYEPIHNEEEDQEVWIDPAGGVHHGNHGDPARMYE